MEESGKRVKRVVDEGLRAIDKRTGKYVNVIKRTIEYSDYMRYIIANTLQEYEGEVTLNQIPENKATEEEISKYGIEVYPTIIVSGDNMDGFNKLEGMARKADLINVMSLYDKK